METLPLVTHRHAFVWELFYSVLVNMVYFLTRDYFAGNFYLPFKLKREETLTACFNLTGSSGLILFK